MITGMTEFRRNRNPDGHQLMKQRENDTECFSLQSGNDNQFLQTSRISVE